MRASLSDLNRRDLMKVARAGDAQAQLEVALSYIWGERGFPVSERQARIWYKKSAINGNIDATFNLGTMCLYGEGGKKDVQEAVRLIKIVATSRRKHSYIEDAPKLLSWIYRDKEAGVFDLKESELWEKLYEKRVAARR